ncbi:MAG: hypothetical protein HOV81_17300 [Kofleriaceae bacterium]|nr:hypothetical protein [Kofleriaceae bacterium]
MRRVGLLILLVACGHPGGSDNGRDASTGGGDGDGSISDASVTGDGGGDAGTGNDDAGSNAGGDAGGMDAPAGVITGGPCMSGAAGATAYRVRWANGGGTAYPVYEVNGLPDKTRDHVGAYGYQIGFTAQYVDPYLAQGGLQLDGSDFVDIDLSTVGIASITSAKLSIYGRSFNTTASGSFNWQTFHGTGSTPTNFVSNVAPYAWYTADMTTEIPPGDGGAKLRIKAGPSSGSLVVNRIELCVVAN